MSNMTYIPLHTMFQDKFQSDSASSWFGFTVNLYPIYFVKGNPNWAKLYLQSIPLQCITSFLSPFYSACLTGRERKSYVTKFFSVLCGSINVKSFLNAMQHNHRGFDSYLFYKLGKIKNIFFFLIFGLTILEIVPFQL